MYRSVFLGLLLTAAAAVPGVTGCKKDNTGGSGGSGGGGAEAGSAGMAGGGAAGMAGGGAGGSAGATGCAVDGTWDCTVTSLEDPAGHDPFIGKPLASPITCTGTGTTMSCSGSAPFVPVTGSLAADCSFDLAGSGTVASFSNVTVKMTGSGATGKLVGKYVMGAGGELPQGKPMTVNFTATKQ